MHAKITIGCYLIGQTIEEMKHFRTKVFDSRKVFNTGGVTRNSERQQGVHH